MSKSNVSDIDYSVFNTTTSSETPSEAPKLKSEGISKRSIVKAKAEEKPRDLTNASNPAQIAQRATDTANALPNVEVPDTLANYALPVLGAIGTGLAAYGLWKNQNKLPLGETVAGAPPEGMTQKTDLRNVQPVAETPAAPQPEFPKATTQQSALPQGYGQQTINAPTGAPAVPTAAPQPVAPAAPAPVDPIQEAKIREARAKAAIAEHKLQQLQAGPKTAPASAKSSVSEADLQMIQKSGAAGTAKELQAMEAARKIAPTPDPIQATATPVEKQAAVDVVKRQEQKQVGVKPEYPKKEVFKTVPEGYVFRPDVGNLDRSLGNVLGLEHREYARELFNQGKPFGHSADVNKDVSRITTEYFKHLQSQVPETILSRDARKLQNIPSDFGTFAKGTDFGQKAKVAGTLGTLLAATSAANAATKGDMAPTKELGFDLATGAGLAKVLGGPAALIASLGLGSAGLNKDEEKQLAYRQKVGAGRGIAPPSSYQR